MPRSRTIQRKVCITSTGGSTARTRQRSSVGGSPSRARHSCKSRTRLWTHSCLFELGLERHVVMDIPLIPLIPCSSFFFFFFYRHQVTMLAVYKGPPAAMSEGLGEYW